jgi:hypothetical protein
MVVPRLWLHHEPMKEAQPMSQEHLDSRDATPTPPSEHIPWYIIVSKLSLAVGTSLALLTGG